MRPVESEKLHQAADVIWEIAKQAKAEGHLELEQTLKEFCDMMHARASGQRSSYRPPF